MGCSEKGIRPLLVRWFGFMIRYRPDQADLLKPHENRADEPPQMQTNDPQEAQDELVNLMTIMYMLMQHALVFPEELAALLSQLRMSWAHALQSKIWMLTQCS